MTLIVKLSPSTRVSSVTTFEEAFCGEQSSDFRGKGKEKRAARVEKKQAAKQRIHAAKASTKVAKQANKGAVKAAKQEKKATKGLAKQARKTNVKAARVNKRSNTMQLRQGLKADRKGLRLQRKAMGQDAELEEEELPEQEVAAEEPEMLEEPELEQEEYSEEASEEEPAEEEELEETESEEEEPTEEEMEEAEEPFSGRDYYDNFAEDLANFAGQDEINLEANMSYSFKGPDGEKITEKIHPKVFEHAKKIEWNKDRVSKLEPLFHSAHASKKKEIADKIQLHKNTALALESKLDGYANLDGKDNDSYAIGKRVAEGSAALREARKLRMKARISSGKSLAARKSGRSLTEIEQNLNPVVKPNEIEIPPRMDSSADGGGGLVTKVKLAAKKADWKNVAIGLVIAGAAIYAIDKLKLI